MGYLVFLDEKKAEEARAKRDVELGYPESLDSLRHVGGGRHCPKEFGRAEHYCRMTKSDKEEKWALEDLGKEAVVYDEKVEDLPVDWFTEAIEP